MKPETKGILWGLGIGILIILISYLLPWITCPDFFRIGPPTPTDQPICSMIVSNPLSTHLPFPVILTVWIPWLLITGIIGLLVVVVYRKINSK